MGKICDESMKEFPDIFEITINNWKILIAHEIYGKWSEVPKRYIEEIQEREKKYGKTLKISKPDFPRLSKWERPSNVITIFKRDGSVYTEKIH